MREPDRDGVLEAAVPRARDQQGWDSRGLCYSGPIPAAFCCLSLARWHCGVGLVGESEGRGCCLWRHFPHF